MKLEEFLNSVRIPIGDKVRVTCCASDKSAVVSSSIRGTSLICFRCGDKQYVPHTKSIDTNREILQYIRQQSDRNMGITYPEDTVWGDDVPPEIITWLGTKGMYTNEFGYSAELHRVVIPVTDWTGKIVSVLLRAVHPDAKRKYMALSGISLENTLYVPDSYPKDEDGKFDVHSVVLVEDAISAHRCSLPQYGILGAALLGTKITDGKIGSLLMLRAACKNIPRIVTWYDSDSSGYKCAQSTAKKLWLYNIRVENVSTVHDPKHYPDLDIYQHVMFKTQRDTHT